MADGTVNGQVLEAAGLGSAVTVGAAPATAMAMTYATGADTIGMVMHNAVTAQHGMQTVARAAVATTCAYIIAAAAKPPA
jgi:hypothetical protein